MPGEFYFVKILQYWWKALLIIVLLIIGIYGHPIYY